MNIDFDWINRIGIILNFLAGFMLAPDIIGKENINFFEDKLEIKINYLIIKTQVSLRGYKDWINKNKYQIRKRINIFFSTILVIFLVGALALLMPIISKFDIDKPTIKPFQGYIYNSIFLLAISYLINNPEKIENLIVCLLRQLLSKMQKVKQYFNEKDTILKLLSFWGIIFFIIGNLLQLFATFK